MRHILIICSLALIIHCSEEEPSSMQDTLPNLSIRDALVMEGDNNQTLSLEIFYTGQATNPVSVDVSTQDGTAIAGSDFVALSGQTISFSSGTNSAFVELTIIGDTEKEDPETFLVSLANPINANIIRSSGTVTIENDDIPATSITAEIPSTGYSSPESYPGMELAWSDEFRQDKLNLEDWTFEFGDNGWGNNELQFYQDLNTEILEEDYLVIEAREEFAGNSRYTSSRIITKGKQEYRYGRIDIRAVLPKGQGIWPALWMLGRNIDEVGWPACGEIDIMEIIGNLPAELHGTAHWDNSGNYASFGQSTTLPSGDFSDQFHVFSIIWDENSIKWLLDGEQYNEIDIRPSGLIEFRNPFFFIFNIAVGGNWPGSPDTTTQFPQHMIIDYIRVFQ